MLAGINDHRIMTIATAGIVAVQPKRILSGWVRLAGNDLYIKDEKIPLHPDGRVRVIGFGKSATSMAQALEAILGDKIETGFVISKQNPAVRIPLRKICFAEGTHPVPSEYNIRYTGIMLDYVRERREEDTYFVLVSGGGSALFASPKPGISLADLSSLTTDLLRRHVSIQDINAVRKHFSEVKGGQLAKLLAPAQCIAFIMSDVPGDDLASIASGPTVPDPTTYQDAYDILKKCDLLDSLPEAMRNCLNRGLAGEEPETPKEHDPVFQRTRNYLISKNAVALQATANVIKALEIEPMIDFTPVTGQVRQVAAQFLERARNQRDRRPEMSFCMLAGGEVTVEIVGSGHGGRCQEFVLECLRLMNEQDKNFTFFAAGTDGEDGPTNAAGAWGDWDILQESLRREKPPEVFLANSDSYHYFDQFGGHIKTGPTRTNVGDMMGIIYDAD